MSDQAQFSRRSLVGTVVAGAVLGGIWGAAFPALSMETRSTVAVIGRDGAQLVLVDSTKTRALILVGEPDASLVNRLPAVMTLFRQRIDLIIAGQAVLLQYAAELGDRWRIRHAISLQQGYGGATPAIPTTAVADSITIDLGGQMSVHCRVGHRGNWDRRLPAQDATLWTVTLQHPGGTIAIASDSASLEAATPAAADLLISPDLPSAALAGRLPIQSFACNDDSDTLESTLEGDAMVTRIYPEDIARFVLHEEGIDLPPWTHHP